MKEMAPQVILRAIPAKKKHKYGKKLLFSFFVFTGGSSDSSAPSVTTATKINTINIIILH